MKLFDVDYYGQHVCNSHGRIVHPNVVVEPATHDDGGVPIVNQSSSSSTSYAHGVQDESFGDLFMVPDMPEYLTELTDVEMANAFGFTASMNSPLLVSEDILWA